MMATTGISNFTVTRDDVIKAAMRALGALGVGESPVAEDYVNCSQALNIMIKSWMKKGAALHVYSELSLPLTAGIQSYPIGPTAGYLTTAGVSITAAGTGGANGTYALGISDAGGGTGAIGTYTISGGVLSSIAITAPGNSYVSPVLSFPSGGISGASASATVVGLTAVRPLRVLDAFIRNPQGLDTSLIPISRQEYDILGNKSSLGISNQYYFDAQLNNASVYLYNPIVQSGYVAHFVVQRPFYDMNSSTDNFDFPQEWFQALKWGLADELSSEYGASPTLIGLCSARARQYADECFEWSVEEASVMFTVNTQGIQGSAR